MVFLACKAIPVTSERAIQWAEKILYHVRNMIIFHIGIAEIELNLARNAVDNLRKLFAPLSPLVSNFFTEKPQLSLSFNSLYSSTKISHVKDAGLSEFCIALKNVFKVEHIACYSELSLVFSSKPWLQVHEADRF